MNLKTSQIKKRYLELEKQLTNPQITQNPNKFKDLSKEYSQLKEVYELITQLEQYDKNLLSIKTELEKEKDPDMIELYKQEQEDLNSKIQSLKKQIREKLQSKNKDDSKNAILEIRAGTGGEEAALFARELFRMYSRYSEDNGWSIKIVSSHYTGNGGIKEIIAIIEGNEAFGKLKYESGIHRVQRVPITESSGRLHTSAVSVVILPEIDDNKDIEINENEIKIDVYRATGPGGQSVNTTDSAVRITHIPSGIVVTCQDEKSQHKNKARALKILKSKLYQQEQERLNKETGAKRKQAIKSGDRSEKIKTYNFPQQRVTDHRIKKSWFNLEEILDGKLDEILTETATILSDENDTKE